MESNKTASDALKNVGLFLSKHRNTKGLDKAQNIFNSFSITEKTLFFVLAAVFVFAALSLVYEVNSRYLTEVPTHGGKLIEGILGTPRFINPLLALSDADRDLTALVYSGLLRATPEGDFVPDLARSFSVSDDGLSYSFIIRDSAVFHDGVKVTADDVIYTMNKAQDSALKSPRRASFEGVTAEKISEHEIIFRLKQPYAPFITNLTLGILPKHLWENIEGDQFTFSLLNINAVGSGPYAIESIEKGNDGVPSQLTLKANEYYTLAKPLIEKIIFKFYQNEPDLVTALSEDVVESAANIGPEKMADLPDRLAIMRAPLTRIFGVFFNQNEKEILAHKEVRKALAMALNRENIISNVLHGYGRAVTGPLPATLAQKYLAPSGNKNGSTTIATSTVDTSLDEASALLERSGWKENIDTGIYELKTKGKNTISTLAFSLSTANISELVLSANIIADAWKELGVDVDVRIFETSDLNQSVIRPRRYDALLFGIVTGRHLDLYPFWHSSQRNDPGLNIALYTNTRVDKALETMRNTNDRASAGEALATFEKEIENDTPAIFIWSPDFAYAVPKKLSGVKLGEITTASDRFINVHQWYMKTDKIWRIFIN